MDDLHDFASQAAAVLDADRQRESALHIAATLAAFGRQLLEDGVPKVLVADLVVQAGEALWAAYYNDGEA